MTTQYRNKALKIVRGSGLIRPRDLVSAGVPAWALYELVKSGDVEQVARGVYQRKNHPATEHHSYAEAIKRVPQGIVCLLSALRFHELTVQNPAEVWLAISRTAWRPRAGDGVQIHFVRYSGKGLTAGIESHLVEGVPVSVTSVARTVADCFKYRNKIGRDVALEALQEGWRQKRFTMDDLWRYAELGRVTKVMLPYLETLSP